MNEFDNNRIISSFLSMNADIMRLEKDSKLPKFISRTRSKIYRKKLLKILDKIKNANVPLSKDNIKELFSYINSSYQNSKVGCIESTNIISINDESILIGVIRIDNITATFKFNLDKIEKTFLLDILCIDKEEKKNSQDKTLNKTYQVNINRLEYKKNPEISDIFEILNKALYQEIYDCISLFIVTSSLFN